MQELNANVKNYENFLQGINKIVTGVGDLTPVFKNFYKVYTNNFVRKQFLTEGSFLGYKWKPLTLKYAIWKKRKVGNKTILRFSDKMFNAVTGTDKSTSYYVINPKKLEFGIRNIPYAKFHQYGTVHMPKREFLFIDNKIPFKALLFLRDECKKYVSVLVKFAKDKGLI